MAMEVGSLLCEPAEVSCAYELRPPPAVPLVVAILLGQPPIPARLRVTAGTAACGCRFNQALQTLQLRPTYEDVFQVWAE